jgi:hypothetical protein
VTFRLSLDSTHEKCHLVINYLSDASIFIFKKDKGDVSAFVGLMTNVIRGLKLLENFVKSIGSYDGRCSIYSSSLFD